MWVTAERLSKLCVSRASYPRPPGRAAEFETAFCVYEQACHGSNGGSRRICLDDVDAQRPRQGLQSDRFHASCPAVVERQYGLGTPDDNASLGCADLTIGKLARIALLQLVKD